MAEIGGEQVFVGSAGPEKSKSGVLERVKNRVQKGLENIQQEMNRRTSFGKEMQAHALDKYARVVGELNPSLLKTFLQKQEWLAKINAKLYGVGSAAADVTASSIAKGTGNLLLLLGGVSGGTELGLAFNQKKWPKTGVMLESVLATYGGIRLKDTAKKLGDKSPGRWVAKKSLDAGEFVALKGVDLLNKIIGRKPMPAMG